MKQFSCLFACVFCFQWCFAQGVEVPYEREQEILKKLGANTGNLAEMEMFDQRYEGVEGTPYLEDKWFENSKIQVEENLLTNLQLKYDVAYHHLVIKKNEKAFFLNTSLIRSFFVFDSLNNVWREFQRVHKRPKSPFYEVLAGERFQLLLAVSKQFQKASLEPGSFSSTGDRFVETEKFFVQTPQGDLFELKLSKKAFKEIFKESDEIAWKEKKATNAKLSDRGSLKQLFINLENALK